jgi:predicted P-loop ATPase/GTPase
MANLSNLARMHTSTVGSGSFVTLTTAADGCLTFFESGMVDGLAYSYGIIDQSNSEVGTGIFDVSGSKITRNVLNSTNSGSRVSLSGSGEIFITALSQDFVSSISGSSIMSDTTGSIVKHNTSGVVSGSYNKVDVDTYGHVTSASVIAVPLTATAVSGKALYSYDSTTGSFTNINIPLTASSVAGKALYSYDATTGSFTNINIPLTATAVAGKALYSYDATTGSFTNINIPLTATAVAGKALYSYDATTGSFVNVNIPITATAVSGRALDSYNSVTGSFTNLAVLTSVAGSSVMSDTTGSQIKHNASGITSGSYNKVQVDTFGHITSASIVAVPSNTTSVAGSVFNAYNSTTGSFTTLAVLTAIAGSSVMSDSTGSQVKHNSSGVTTGSYNKIQVDVFGHVTSASIVAVPLQTTVVSGSALTGYNTTTGSFTTGVVSHIIQSAGSTLATEPVLNFINNEIIDSSGSTVVRNWNKHNQEIVTGTTVTVESTESAIFVGGYTVTGTLNIYGKLVVL